MTETSLLCENEVQINQVVLFVVSYIVSGRDPLPIFVVNTNLRGSFGGEFRTQYLVYNLSVLTLQMIY